MSNNRTNEAAYNRMMGIGENFPEFNVSACLSLAPGEEFGNITRKDIQGKWSVFFFWPMDFTFVCPTEIIEFDHESKSFRDRETQVFGVSTDSQYVHLGWRNAHPGLKKIGIPMLADNKKELCEALGILHQQEKVPYRATYIVDPRGVIRWVCVNDLKVGRNVSEVLRTLDALQTEQLTPCNWQKGNATLK